MTGGGLIQLLTVGVEDAPLILNPEITFFKTIYRKHTNFSMEQIVKNIGTKKFDCFHQFKIEKVTDLLSGLHFIIDIPYFDVLKMVTTKIINPDNIIKINELSIMYSNIKTYLFFESISDKYYLIPESFFNLSEIDNFTNSVELSKLKNNLLKDLYIVNNDIIHNISLYGSKVEILQLKNSTLNQILPVIRLNFDHWSEFWLKIINKKENFNYFTRLLSQLSVIDDSIKRLNLIIFDNFNNYNIFYDNKEYLNFSDEIKNYNLLENIVLENPIFDSDYAVNYAIKNNLDIEKYKLETIKFNSLFFLFLLQTLYPDFTTNIKSFTFWKKYNLFKDNSVNNELPITSNNYFLEWFSRFDFYKETSYGVEYEKLNIEIYSIFLKKYNECESNINLLFNTIDIKEKEKLWCILYTIYLRFNNKDTKTPLNTICFDDYFSVNPYSEYDSGVLTIENQINENLQSYSTLINENLVKDDNLSIFDTYNYIQPVDLALLYVYLCYNYIDLIIKDEIFNDRHFLVLWRNKINIAYFFRTADILDNYDSDNKKINNSLKNVFNSLHDYNETKSLTFYHNIDLTREINLDIIRDELIKTIYSESFFGTVDIETNNLDVNDITISPYEKNSSDYAIKNQTIEISEDLTVNFIIENTKIIIKNWNRNMFNQLFIKNNGYYVEMIDFEITDNTIIITNQNLNLSNLSTIDIRTINKLKIPIVDIKDTNNISLCNKRVISNRIELYKNEYDNNFYKSINNINNKQILCDISYDEKYFYQLDIKYIDNSIERINVDFSNNYFVSELKLKFNKIKNIYLDCIDLKLLEIFDTTEINFDPLNNYSSFKFDSPILELSSSDNLWLIATHFNNKKIPKEIFISVKMSESKTIFRIDGTINPLSYSYSLFKLNSDILLSIPNLFSVLHHPNNYSSQTSSYNYKYSINQSFYQLPMIFKIITAPTDTTDDYNNIPLYIFYNINMSENATIKLNNKNVIKICPINSNQFYRDTNKNIPVIFEYKNLNKYLSKSELVNLLIDKFDKTFIYNSLYGNIIKVLEQSNKLYKNLIADSIELLKKLGKSIEHVIDTSKIINEINLLNYSNRDFDIYSVLAPKYYNTNSMLLGMNTIDITNQWFIFKQIKDIYKPSNKISTNLSYYLKNVSNTILKHIEYLEDNNEIIKIFNRNQYQEKYDYFHILHNSIQTNYLTIDNYTIETLYDMGNNYLSENTEIYFNNILLDISSNNVVTDISNNLFEITDNDSFLTEKFIENKDSYSNEKFNYLGAVQFKNGNFNFNNNITNIQYILTDDLEIIDLSSVTVSNLKTYYNSYQININENNINGNFTTTKYIYELEIPSYSVSTLLNQGILISGNYYDFFKNNNYILIGEKELVLSPYAIIGDSLGSMISFIPTSTINILNIKIVNNFKSNIIISGNHTNKLININTTQYKLIDSITNNIDTYYSIESTTDIKLYNFSKIQLLPPFNFINNKISYNNDNKDFIIDNFNNDYWYKLDTSIIQGAKLKNLNISGNYNLYLYPNKFLKLVNFFPVSESSTPVTGTILNGILVLSNPYIVPNYSYISIKNYVYFIKQVSESYPLDDYLVEDINTPENVYLLDNSNFINCNSQYISIISNSLTETILPSRTYVYNDIIIDDGLSKIVSNYLYDFKDDLKLETELDLYVNFSSTQYNFSRPINFTSNTNVFRVELKRNLLNYGNFLCYKQSDLVNNQISGTITDTDNSIINGLVSIDDNLIISEDTFTLTSKEGIQKYKLYDSNNNYTYIWTLLLDDNDYTKFDIEFSNKILNPIIINSNSTTLIVDLLNYTVSTNNNKLLDVSNNNLYFNNDFKNDLKLETELDLYVNFSSTQYNFIRPINFTSNTNVFRVILSRNSLEYGNFLCYKQSDLVNNQISGTITDTDNNIINGLVSIDDNLIISEDSFTLTSKEGIQKYKLYDSNNNYTYIWTLLLDTQFDIELSTNIRDPIIINSNSTLIVDLLNYTVSTNNNKLLSESNKKLYFNNYFTNITKKQMYYSSFIIGEYKLEKLENNYNSSDIIYCNLDDLGIIQETDINGNQLSIENFDIYKYIILLDTSSNYKYYNVLSSDKSLNKIIVDDEIEKKIYNAYGFKRNLIFIKNKSSIWKSLTNYYLDTNKNCLFIDDIIMLNNNIFKVIGLNSFKNLYEIELIRKYNDLKLFSDGYYLLYSRNIVPNIPKFEPIVEFTIDDTNNLKYKFIINEIESLGMVLGISENFCIKEGNNIILYYKNGVLYNPFNYFLNNGDYLIYDPDNDNYKFKISFIFNNVIRLEEYLSQSFSNNSENYYTFYYPYQPCTMENLIFNSEGKLLNYYNKNINYYFEYDNQFIKQFETELLFDSSLYTRVIKFPKNQFYFENKKNNYLEGKLLKINDTRFNEIEITENLSGYNFFYNQPILINNTIKLIKLRLEINKFLVTNNFLSKDLDLETTNDQNLKIYLGKKNIQNIYSNYLLDKVNYLKPKVNLGLYHYYHIIFENINNETINYRKSNILDETLNSTNIDSDLKADIHTLIFEDNVLLNTKSCKYDNISSNPIYDSSFNYLNYNNSYYILLEKTETNQYVSHLCQIKFQNKLKIFTPVENYKSTFYLNKIYPIKLNIDNTFEYLDLVIYKQTILNKKPANEIHIFKKFNISVNGIIESLSNGDFKVEVNIGNLSNYINNSEIYTNNKILCKIIQDETNSLYYLETSNYPEDFTYLYIKEINYIKNLIKQDFTYLDEVYNKLDSHRIIEKNHYDESIKLFVYLKTILETKFYYLYVIDNPKYHQFDLIENSFYNFNDNFSINNLNNNIIKIEKREIQLDENRYFITSANEITNDETYIYLNNIKTNIFDESTLQCDIDSIFEILFFETDFYHSILFNRLKPWNSWSIITCQISEINNYLINGPLIYDKTDGLRPHDVPNELVYFTNNEFSDLLNSLSSTAFNIEKYNKIKIYQDKIYTYLNSFFKYYEFWKDPKTYINNFAIDINSQITFNGLHLELNGEEIDDNIIINNQFVISYNTEHTIYYITRNKSDIQKEINNFINNIKNEPPNLYGVNILDVLKELVKISNNLINVKNIIKNTSFETKNFTDLLLNVLKNELYGKTSNLDIDLTELKKSFVVENFQLNDNDVKDNIITFDTSYNFINYVLEYPTDTFKIMNMVNIPYNINYSIDTQSGLYLYKITLLDEKYESYIIYKLDFLSGLNTLIEPITINNPLVFNNQINFYYKENFDINIDYVISSFKTYDVSSEFLGYLYEVNIPLINFNDFTTIKYKQTELRAYDNYLVSPIYLESFSSYIQAETPIGIDKYEYEILNKKTIITLIKLNISINTTSSQYSVYYYDDSKYYKIENISGNIITINEIINKFTNPKIVVTIKSPTTSNSSFNNTKLYRLTLDEPLISYVDYINFKNVPNNFLINDEIKVIDMKFITDSIVDVQVESTLSETYKINNLVHYAKIGEYPPEPINQINLERLYLYRFNNFVPFNDISSCFIVHDLSYNKNVNSTVYINNFIRNIGSANYSLSTDVIQDLSGIKFITNKFLKDEEMQYNVFGGVINTFNISDYIYDSINKTITFIIPQKLIIDSDYYYILNNTYLEISNISINQNNLIINWINGVISGIIVFKQVIIEKEIIKPNNNQIYTIELFNNLDLNTNGYLQVLNNEGNEVGQFIYRIYNISDSGNISISNLLNTYDVLINNSNMLKGTILYKNPLYIITNKLIKTFFSLTIVDTSITLTDISGVLIQNTYIPYEIYKSNGLKNYSLFIKQNNLLNIENLNFEITDKNKFSIIGRYGKFKLEKIYQNQQIEPTPKLVFNLENKISYVKENQIETVKFNSDIYKNIFENIDFCIGDQIIERLDKTTFEMQYQFLKDPQKKIQIEKITKMYDYEGKMRLVIPLEFWFNNQANMYLPLISLPYTDVSIKFKLNKLNEILGSNYTIISEPDINIQVNIDGIILDTFERDMFGNNKHEYLIERFMQYPDNLIDKTSSVIKMIFKNPIKDIYYKTEVLGSSDTCFYTTKIIMDDWQKEYKNKKALYTDIYTNTNSNSKEFEIIRIAINENILKKSPRYISFNKSQILKKYDMEMTIYLDEKYQKKIEKLKKRKINLELYYTKIYNYKEIKTPIPIIESMVIKTNGKDLFKEIDHTYFNKIIPYQKYLNSVDMGYYIYSFSLNPLDNQPSGHLNFSLFDDIILKSENNYQVVTKPVILKTIVREYNLLRIMSGLSSLAWID
jgi:hypothetical protein